MRAVGNSRCQRLLRGSVRAVGNAAERAALQGVVWVNRSKNIPLEGWGWQGTLDDAFNTAQITLVDHVQEWTVT